MRQMDIYNILKTLNMPVSYMKFSAKQTLPFLIYNFSEPEILAAENIVYSSKNHYEVNYYFDKKDLRIEKKIEELFNENEIYYKKTEDIYIEDEDMYMITYEV